MAHTRFADRTAAGAQLAQALLRCTLPPPVVVLALPRGGVTVGAEIARALNAPLDVLLVRKIGAPFQRELAMAAVVEGTPPEVVMNEELHPLPGVNDDYIHSELPAHIAELQRRRQLYRHGRPPPVLEGTTTVVVDDGIATGTTLRAALLALRRRKPARLVVAVPVAPPETVAALRPLVDELVCLSQPTPFHAIGLHYQDFHQVSDAEVCTALDEANAAHAPGISAPAPH